MPVGQHHNEEWMLEDKHQQGNGTKIQIARVTAEELHRGDTRESGADEWQE